MLCGIFGAIFFGWLSDKIGRKVIVMCGFLFGAVFYFPLFMLLTHFGNPQLEFALNNISVVLEADPADCTFQFVPSDLKSYVKFSSSCDKIKNVLNQYSVSYINKPGLAGMPAKIYIGGQRIDSNEVSLFG